MCIRDSVHAVPAARAAPVVEEGKLERKAAVKVVKAGAPPVKDGRLIFGLCELVVDVLVFNGFGVIAVRYPAHSVDVYKRQGSQFPKRQRFSLRPLRPVLQPLLPLWNLSLIHILVITSNIQPHNNTCFLIRSRQKNNWHF